MPISSSAPIDPARTLRPGEWVLERWDRQYGVNELTQRTQYVRQATALEEGRYELTFALPLTPDAPFPSHYAGTFEPPLPAPTARSEDLLHVDWSGAGFVRELGALPAGRAPAEGAPWPGIIPFLVSLPLAFRTPEHASATVERVAADAMIVRIGYADPELPPPRWEYRSVAATGTLEIDRATGRPRALALDVQIRNHSHGRDLVPTIFPGIEKITATWEYGRGASPAAP